MFAYLAAVLALVGYAIDGSGAHASAWLSPSVLGLAAPCCLAMHMLGIGTWPRNRP